MLRLPISRRRFLATLDRARVEAAIRSAEARTSAELRVSIARFFWGAPAWVAARAFAALGMSATAARNGVLVFVAPGRRAVVVHADDGLRALVPPATWESLAARCAAGIGAGQTTEALVATVDELAALLARHAPPRPGPNANELPDTVNVE